MYDEIAKIVFNYSIKNLLLDYNAIENIISTIVRRNDLSEYIKSINFNDSIISNMDYMGAYNKPKKELNINYFNFKFAFLSSKHQDYLFFNLYFLLVILHEIDHIKLYKDVTNNSTNIDAYFSKIINSYTNDIILIMKGKKQLVRANKYKKLYIKYHDINPDERRANINSHIELNNIITILNNTSISSNSINNSKYLMLISFIKYCLIGYKIIKNNISNSPSYDFVKLLKQEEFLDSLNLFEKNPIKTYQNAKEKYSFQKRILYGLPLNKEELEQINEHDNPFKIYKKKV